MKRINSLILEGLVKEVQKQNVNTFFKIENEYGIFNCCVASSSTLKIKQGDEVRIVGILNPDYILVEHYERRNVK